MRLKSTVLSALSILTCLAFSGAQANDDLVRGIFGVIAAGVAQGVQNQNQQQQRQPQDVYRSQQQVFTVENEAAERKAFRAEIQRRLNLLGFDAGVPDGSFGARTRQAIANFQSKIGRRPTGKISEAEIAALYESTNGQIDRGMVARAAGSAGARPVAAQAFAEPEMPQANAQAPVGQNAAAYAEPALPSVQAAAYQEPVAANVANPLVVASGQGQAAQAYVEPAAPQVPAAAANAVPVQSAASANVALLDTVKDAVCSEDSNKFASVKSFIDAGVLDKGVAISKIDESIRRCANTAGTARGFLLGLAGNDITVPIWIDSPGYKHATKNDAWWGSFWLPSDGSNRVLITGNYAQLVMLMDSSGAQYQNDAKFAEQVRANPNKRDCLGLPPMYYAAVARNFEYIKWLLDIGANPNIAVPFIGRGPGLVGEAVDGTGPITDSRQKGYGLISQYGCVDNGPSAALMGAYQARNELVPVWALALDRVRSGQSRDFQIATAMLAKVPSVPPSTIVDIMDDKLWGISINRDEDLAMVKLLVSMGADINASRRDGTKPMAAFIKQGIEKHNLEQLLAVGARI
ncbi:MULTISPECIES: peptidoglycan-binding domain-containing protein [unclassified Rhizobium]|uniref:peptidoglycan-binding domain-containing protein n=1 Tax=unclassified Rhizobium TaxID=2613769 RepID=UPI001ADBFE90|nr:MULTISPECIES: peptidoglycan-binding domain-containing protein [unclassified Rhizobium]MBO9127923.1 peptidoglycan-binding protein [Rhizobium sp. 16-488-2b]MBO9178500.1 peptidoglycan-binding protein [Rhizobium sp. 16-488-2a]